MKFRFRDLENIRYIVVYFGWRDRHFSESLRGAIQTAVPGLSDERSVYHLRVPDGNYDRIRIKLRSHNKPGQAVLESITIQPLAVWDQVRWVYVIALALGVLLLAPGAFTYVVFHRTRLSESGFQVSIFAYSLLFYVVGYVVLVASYALGGAWAHESTLIFCTGLMILLVVLVTKKSAWRDLWRLAWGSYQEFAAYTLLLLLLCLAITYDSNLPLENFFYTDISGPKTFGAFWAHDNVFQYINGSVIADNEPFEKYYGNGQLIYGIEDRQILPGVSNTFLFVLLLSVSAFMIGNYLITWFKLTAGALFLSGLYYMLEKSSREMAANWARSGLFFGLAANMHAGSALGIPLFFLWSLWRSIRDKGIPAKRVLFGCSLLILVFTVAITPWSIVKRVHLDERQALLKTHFLDGYSSPEGLGASARLFLDNTTLEERLAKRFAQLGNAFRVVEVSGLFDTLEEHGFKSFLKQWDQLEFSYSAVVLYPVLAFVLAGWINRRFRYVGPDSAASNDLRTGRVILLISLITMAVVILAHYGRHDPDITYHQPLGVLVLAYATALGFALRSGIGFRAVLSTYMLLSVYRLVIFL